MFATGETVGLAEWIIDDTCLVYYIFYEIDNITPDVDDLNEDEQALLDLGSSDPSTLAEINVKVYISTVSLKRIILDKTTLFSF